MLQRSSLLSSGEPTCLPPSEREELVFSPAKVAWGKGINVHLGARAAGPGISTSHASDERGAPQEPAP